jgi:mannitol/fructose-specific phosphotransferase system IIA component (Ntr-type)
MNISGICIPHREEDGGEQNYPDVVISGKKKPLKFHNLNGSSIKVSSVMTLLQK